MTSPPLPHHYCHRDRYQRNCNKNHKNPHLTVSDAFTFFFLVALTFVSSTTIATTMNQALSLSSMVPMVDAFSITRLTPLKFMIKDQRQGRTSKMITRKVVSHRSALFAIVVDPLPVSAVTASIAVAMEDNVVIIRPDSNGMINSLSSPSSCVSSSSSSLSSWLLSSDLGSSSLTPLTPSLSLPKSSSLSSLPSLTPKKLSGATYNSYDNDPTTLRPICPNSDRAYRSLRSLSRYIVGSESFEEYGPLLSPALLRVRLELCVVESFISEALLPFVEKEGLGWILPLRETPGTFLAGTSFAFALTFVGVGTTKVASVLLFYADVFLGLPLRFIGGFAFDRAVGRPVIFDIGLPFGLWTKRLVGPGEPPKLSRKEKRRERELKEQDGPIDRFKDDVEQAFGDIDDGNNDSNVKGGNSNKNNNLPLVLLSGSIKLLGEGLGLAKDAAESIDLFAGRYVTVVATGYIAIKFLHFKVFDDFPPLM